jgi:hypothetical protein
MVLNGKIRDAKTISSVLWLDHQVANKNPLVFDTRRKPAVRGKS